MPSGHRTAARLAPARADTGGAAVNELAAMPESCTTGDDGARGPTRQWAMLDLLPSRQRRLSCGIVVLLESRELLLCHVTGQRHWDLPKGGIHDGETPIEAALRETHEETGLCLGAEALLDIGRHVYTAKKDLHLFACLSQRIDPRELHCASCFVERGSRADRGRRWTASAGSPSTGSRPCARPSWRRCSLASSTSKPPSSSSTPRAASRSLPDEKPALT